MKFVFDENHPPLLADMLAVLAKDEAYDVTSVEALGFRGFPDVKLFPAIIALDPKSVLVTVDRAMRKRKHELEAIRDTGMVIVVGGKNWNQQSELWERARMMLWWWPTIVSSVSKADRASFLELPWRRQVKSLGRWRA